MLSDWSRTKLTVEISNMEMMSDDVIMFVRKLSLIIFHNIMVRGLIGSCECSATAFSAVSIETILFHQNDMYLLILARAFSRMFDNKTKLKISTSPPATRS